MSLDPRELRDDATHVARAALAEDGDRDVTSEVCIPRGTPGRAVLEVREACTLAGTIYADAVIAICGLPPIAWRGAEGSRFEAGSVTADLRGDLRALLRAERPLLNLLQRACGIATMTRAYVDAVAGTSCRVLHIRKTTPGLRLFEVHAVLVGGGTRHRLDLAHELMVKDNHWQGLRRAGRTLRDALDQARHEGVTSLQVEVESMAQLEEACDAGATRLLIDNQTPATVAEWSVMARRRVPGIEIEATGGITLATVRAYAETGVDFVSTGALTHSVRAIDLGLEVTAG